MYENVLNSGGILRFTLSPLKTYVILEFICDLTSLKLRGNVLRMGRF